MIGGSDTTSNGSFGTRFLCNEEQVAVYPTSATTRKGVRDCLRIMEWNPTEYWQNASGLNLFFCLPVSVCFHWMYHELPSRHWTSLNQWWSYSYCLDNRVYGCATWWSACSFSRYSFIRMDSRFANFSFIRNLSETRCVLVNLGIVSLPSAAVAKQARVDPYVGGMLG